MAVVGFLGAVLYLLFALGDPLVGGTGSGLPKVYALVYEPNLYASLMAALEDSVPSTGYLPDQGAAPRVPYQPADDDPFRAATDDGGTSDLDGLWILPLTAFDPGPWLSPSRRLARRVRFAGRPLHRPAELWAPAEPAAFWNLALESADELPTPYLSLAVRSDCLIRPALSKPVKDKLEALFAGPWAERMAFTTPTEALRQLTGNE